MPQEPGSNDVARDTPEAFAELLEEAEDCLQVAMRGGDFHDTLNVLESLMAMAVVLDARLRKAGL